MAPRWYNVINAFRANRLYRSLKNWRLVGIRLAKEEGREICYNGESVRQAVHKYLAGKRSAIPGQDDTFE